MATKVGGYHIKDGTKVPSVTTILSRYKESGGLIHWSWQLGKEGRDYREVRDAAADAGTLAHQMIEQWAQGAQPSITGDPDVVAKAQQAFGAFLEWAGQTHLQIIHSEVALISERHKFGGTLDAMLVNNKLSLGDWKSANAVYADNLMQLAAYGILWEEAHPDQPIMGGYHLMRFSKNEGDFEHRWFGDLSDARECFLLLRQAYDYDKKLKARVR